MLSIIISTYQPALYNVLSKNIEQTCGVEYEIVKIENPGLMGICEAYNTGADLAKFENLLFIHEDILFQEQNWGAKLLGHLQLKNVGVLGVAGSDYVPFAPCGWNIDEPAHTKIYFKGPANSKTEIATINSTCDKILNPVFALDGVFMAVKRSVFQEIRFDETLEGFHGYDLDFSLRVSQKFRNFVVADILIEHLSHGNPNKQWLVNNIKVRRKKLGPFQSHNIAEIERRMFTNFLSLFFRNFEVNAENLRITLEFFPLKRLSPRDFYKVLKEYGKYIVYRKPLKNEHINNAVK